MNRPPGRKKREPTKTVKTSLPMEVVEGIPTILEYDAKATVLCLEVLLVQYKSLKGKWKTIFVTKDSLEALQVMGDAYKQNPTRLYRTLSQEVFVKGKEPIRDGERRPTPRVS